MTASVLPRLAPSPSWELVSVGSPFVAVAERDALGTTARIATWPPCCLRPALGAVDVELARLDQAASRFRADSEICRVQARASGGTQVVSESLAEVVRVALTAAKWTGGLVDPTVGAALVALGYDKDFVLVGGIIPTFRPPARRFPAGNRSRSKVGYSGCRPGSSSTLAPPPRDWAPTGRRVRR